MTTALATTQPGGLPAVRITKQPHLELREKVNEETGKKDHSYWLTVDGNKKRIPGVTTICGVLDKPALQPWNAKMACLYLSGERDPRDPSGETWLNPPVWTPGKKYTQEQINAALAVARGWARDTARKAADLGTEAHDWMEAYVYGVEQPYPKNPLVRASAEKFLAWRMRHHVEWVEHEWSVTDGKVGGKVDSLAWVDGKLRVLDLKTGNGIWSDHIIQVGKYGHMAQALIDVPLARPIILHASKNDGDFAAYELPMDVEPLAVFFDRLYLDYRAKQELEKMMNALRPMEMPAGDVPKIDNQLQLGVSS